MTATALPEQTRLSPLERLEALCDPDSVRVLRSRVISPKLGEGSAAGQAQLVAQRFQSITAPPVRLISVAVTGDLTQAPEALVYAAPDEAMW